MARTNILQNHKTSHRRKRQGFLKTSYTEFRRESAEDHREKNDFQLVSSIKAKSLFFKSQSEFYNCARSTTLYTRREIIVTEIISQSGMRVWQVYGAKVLGRYRYDFRLCLGIFLVLRLFPCFSDRKYS